MPNVTLNPRHIFFLAHTTYSTIKSGLIDIVYIVMYALSEFWQRVKIQELIFLSPDFHTITGSNIDNISWYTLV